jgi:uncharacterized protein
VTLDDLRRVAIAHSLFTPTTLQGALDRLGFVQADPIRAPARAQDLTLRHRVIGYRAGDLERLYRRLDVHEDFFVNYGFVTGAVQALMHPRGGPAPWTAGRGRHVRTLLDFVRVRGSVHPREVDQHFAHGRVTNYWGGASNATTHLLDAMHYRGLLRVVGREAGIRLYAAHQHQPARRDAATRRAHLDALVDIVVGIYAPLPAPSLSTVVRRLRYAVPQWAHGRIDGVDWYWRADDTPAATEPADVVRLLAPFDPVVWDRRRFEIFWGWAYRFEAYTPVPKRKLGYYALPLLWRDRVIGWGNVSVKNGELRPDFGYIRSGPPRDRAFRRALEDELHRLRIFLGIQSRPGSPAGDIRED